MLEYWYRILNKLIQWRIPFFAYPLKEKDINLDPFFIVGSGRSGNTLLRRILLSHSELYIPPETYVLGLSIKAFRRYNHMFWYDLVHLILSLFEFHPEFETFECTLGPLAKKIAYAPVSSRNLAYILDSFYRYHAEIKGFTPSRWGDKTPLNVYDLPIIRDVFPASQFIHIVRDGCDVVESYLRSGIYEDLESAGQRWSTSVSAYTDFSRKFPESCLEIRYEDLALNPEETVLEICAFLNIEFENSLLGSEELSSQMGDVSVHDHHQRVSGKITASRIGTGREGLTAEQKRTLSPIIDRQLVEMGYQPCHEG